MIYGSGNCVYLRGLTPLKASERYSVFRSGEVLIDPLTGELFDFEAILVFDVMVLKAGDPSTVLLEYNERQALKGDRWLPHNDECTHAFFPRVLKCEINGVIISLFDVTNQINQHQIAVSNAGERNGIEKGRVLATRQKANKA